MLSGNEAMKKSRDEIVGLLSDRGLNVTAQRIAIAEYVLNSRDHPSAEETYQAVSASLPVVSKATVYNTLNLLVKEGLVNVISLQEGGVHYDPWLPSHCHFLDTRTNRIFDVPPDQVKTIQHRLDPSRYQVDDVQVIFRGRILDKDSKARH
jgi:Fe2+ or Zn2+ uptake regulation protein